ncbi:hypothetical protein BGZ58_001934 [Dissophora ornata]|nr:hypothetical protein BGZ58_001934 [Dissophora ornata]
MAPKRTIASRSTSDAVAKVDTVKGSVEGISSTSSTVAQTTEASSNKRSKVRHNYSEDQDDNDEEEEEEEEEKEDDGNYSGSSGNKKQKAAPSKKIEVKTTVKTTASPKKGSTTPIRAGAHTNTTMPSSLTLPKTPEGCVKITSWNVSGLNASLKKGFKTYINAEDADVICLQEHKMNQPPMNLVDSKVYPFSWWGFEKDKKGYAGVAMFSKTTPINVTAGLPTHPDPSCTKGRIVTLEYPTCFVLGCYVPNAGQELVRLKERMIWDVAMREWLLQLKAKGKHIIWTGDLNVCHKPIDLRNPATNTKSAGFTKEERDGFSAILDEVGLVDTFREFQGEGEDAGGQYSYFSYRFQCRVKGIGWRLDYFVTDKELLKERVVESVIREECYGASDHVPVVLIVKGAL